MPLRDPAVMRRAAALLILAGLVLAIWVGPVAAYRSLIDDGAERLVEKTAVLARYRALARGTPAAAAAIDAGLTYPDMPESRAIATLQEAVKGAAAAARVQVQGLQVLRSEAMAGAARVTVRMRGSGDIASLRSLLYAVESARPILHPDNLQIQSRVATPAAAQAPLDFQLDISGFTSGEGT